MAPPHVDFQMATSYKTFTTRLATMWLLTCVPPHVDSQFITTSKSFPAYFAWIRFLTRVCSQMNLQTILMNKSFSTSVTFERLFTCLSTRVNLVLTVWFSVVTFLTMRSQHEGFSLLLQYELLSLLTGAHFLLFLFNLWRFLFLWVQTGAPLLETELLVSENLLLLTDMLLWELWRNKEAQDRGYNWDVKIKTV